MQYKLLKKIVLLLRKMSYKIVVARYNENLNWLLPVIDYCIIFNKGEPLHLKNEIMLKNVGRESETYLHYIIDNYDSLPDVVIFTQGNISDHRKTGYNHLEIMREEALQYGKSGCAYYKNIFFAIEPDFNLKMDVVPQNYGQYRCTFDFWFQSIFKIPFPEEFYIYWHGIFAVRKDLILKRPLQFYKELIKEVNYHVNPTEGHFFERSWFYIFF